MSPMLWWSCEFPACAWSCLQDGWRCQQRYWRSSLFHGARVWLSPAPLPDKLARLARRGCADGIALWHDSSPAGFAWLEQAGAHALPYEGARRQWRDCLRHSQRVWQRGLLLLGREWSRI
ncbi:hypothetical protein [Chromobacterium subtsugae]|uniref:hypothetical protein n=1 Tax=Chromobacterium subtsugae TaxID=251747 RepID=UPI000AD59C6E|nr:hypothetical protein [Chromobacterium subtsugae]